MRDRLQCVCMCVCVCYDAGDGAWPRGLGACWVVLAHTIVLVCLVNLFRDGVLMTGGARRAPAASSTAPSSSSVSLAACCDPQHTGGDARRLRWQWHLPRETGARVLGGIARLPLALCPPCVCICVAGLQAARDHSARRTTGASLRACFVQSLPPPLCGFCFGDGLWIVCGYVVMRLRGCESAPLGG